MRKEIEEKLIALSVGVNTYILNLPKSLLARVCDACNHVARLLTS
jgi:hypothetical protein